MKHLYMPTADSPFYYWLEFLAFLVFVCLCIGGFVVWLKVLHGTKSKRRRKRRRHHRHTNPTLAQTGGLPPKRDPDLPPPGP